MGRREELELQYSDSVARLAAAADAEGAMDKALGLYIRALRTNMGHEGLTRRIIEIYLERNQPCDALTVYERTRNFLWDKSKIEPDATLEELAQQAQTNCNQ
jgi:DNA-binding SARP family transcriptional activator